MIQVAIPTLKRQDWSRMSKWSNVICIDYLSPNKPNDELLKSAYRCIQTEIKSNKKQWEISLSVEIIHVQHHYNGDKLKFLQKYNLKFFAERIFILSNVNGAIFKSLANNEISYKEAEEYAEKSTDYDYAKINELIVK